METKVFFICCPWLSGNLPFERVSLNLQFSSLLGDFSLICLFIAGVWAIGITGRWRQKAIHSPSFNRCVRKWQKSLGLRAARRWPRQSWFLSWLFWRRSSSWPWIRSWVSWLGRFWASEVNLVYGSRGQRKTSQSHTRECGIQWRSVGT